MKKKKMMAIFLTAAMLGSTITVSAGEEGSVVLDTSLDHSQPWYETFEGVEFTTVLNTNGADLPEGKTVEENDMQALFTEITGAKARIAWSASGDAFKEKLNTCIAVGDIPDVMRVSLTQYRQLVKAGLLADMTDAIEEYTSPDLKANYESNGNKALEMLSVDGRIYGIPVTGIVGDGVPLVWIRKDWMEKLNLEEPQSIEDLEKIALAFMEQDPDGNGRDDTQGIAVLPSYDSNYGGSGNLASIFLNVGGAVPSAWVVQEDGTVINGSIMEGAKEALTLLNDWYNKGILPADFATWTADNLSQTLSNNRAGIILTCWWDTYGAIGNSVGADENAEWQAYALPREAGGTFYAPGGDTVGGVFVVNKDFEDPAMFVKINNLMYSSTRIQTEGNTSWSYMPWQTGAAPEVLMATAKTIDAMAKGEISTEEEFIDMMMENGSDGRNAANMHYTAEVFVLPCIEAENPRKGGEKGGDYVTYLARYVAMKAMLNADISYVFNGYEGATEMGNMYDSFLKTLRDDAYTKMIMGDTDGQSISDYFDSFVEDYLSQGGAEVTAEVQAVLDAR